MKYCKNCGQQMDDDARFCSNCGQSVDDEQSSPAKEDKALKGFGVGFLLSFLLGLIGFILGVCLGDEKCKRGSIYGFVTVLMIVFVFYISILIIQYVTISNLLR